MQFIPKSYDALTFYKIIQAWQQENTFKMEKTLVFKLFPWLFPFYILMSPMFHSNTLLGAFVQPSSCIYFPLECYLEGNVTLPLLFNNNYFFLIDISYLIEPQEKLSTFNHLQKQYFQMAPASIIKVFRISSYQKKRWSNTINNIN